MISTRYVLHIGISTRNISSSLHSNCPKLPGQLHNQKQISVHWLSVPVTPCNTRTTYYRDHLLPGQQEPGPQEPGPLITGSRNWKQEPGPQELGAGTTIADDQDLLQVDRKERIILLGLTGSANRRSCCHYLYWPCNGSSDSNGSRPLLLGNINI